jgi:hypothetical protein
VLASAAPRPFEAQDPHAVRGEAAAGAGGEPSVAPADCQPRGGGPLLVPIEPLRDDGSGGRGGGDAAAEESAASSRRHVKDIRGGAAADFGDGLRDSNASRDSGMTVSMPSSAASHALDLLATAERDGYLRSKSAVPGCLARPPSAIQLPITMLLPRPASENGSINGRSPSATSLAGGGLVGGSGSAAQRMAALNTGIRKVHRRTAGYPPPGVLPTGSSSLVSLGRQQHSSVASPSPLWPTQQQQLPAAPSLAPSGLQHQWLQAQAQAPSFALLEPVEALLSAVDDWGYNIFALEEAAQVGVGGEEGRGGEGRVACCFVCDENCT